MKIDYKEFRNLVPATRKFKYLNHAAISPIPLPVLMEAFQFMYEVSESGSIGVNYAERDDLFYLRDNISKLISASPEEISLVPNTSFGINIVLHGIGLNQGDEVLTDSSEFPAIPAASSKLEKLGIKVKIVNVRPETFEYDIIDKINEKTKLIAISSTSFLTGVSPKLSLISKEAKRNGSYLLVDGIQTVGAGKISVEKDEIDFLVAGGYKWLMSPQGSGFLYVRKGLIEDPPWYGWRGDSNYEKFDIHPFSPDKGPRRFELGAYPLAPLVAMNKAIEIIRDNEDTIYDRVLLLSKVNIECLSDKGMEVVTPMEKRVGIVTVKSRNSKRSVAELYKEGIVVSPRGENVRISAHFYNDEEEVKEACEKLAIIEREINL
ncbi:aminotransferase class V-fold PLP-dependent enzyme [Sulfuracidifex metallicus]|uniref:Aminotransferase class V-fold PLP-dependent enzyme n=1 Tax=Sulfuracidifex metallicus DSM 6482 = JCM 9184 TaxID=523847 RepID=A0A6A9QQ02_SULME|nr:aminotransferase class V-fold PLP-dependent enzyme [Sulfuracidifex metallicus]MUN29365.1 aminotransferase class V-fold PLP-dependent enzyme [Sulfuracidifex metallicus DSM 6482 = JCM 9184]WOE50123.1 aminotransferase class V-fold PLP-dependent enzyme [Sulfuracidifex metallicus DSM 6482 = JCM 9184]